MRRISYDPYAHIESKNSSLNFIFLAVLNGFCASESVRESARGVADNAFGSQQSAGDPRIGGVGRIVYWKRGRERWLVP